MTTPPRARVPQSNRMSQLIDSQLRYPDGTPLGDIEEMLVDLRTGRIAYVIVRTAGGRRKQLAWEAIDCNHGELRVRWSALDD